MDRQRIETFLEFLVVGVALGLLEDILAIKFATGEPITAEIVAIVLAVSVPFAAFSELVVDRKDVEISSLLPDFISSRI